MYDKGGIAMREKVHNMAFRGKGPHDRLADRLGCATLLMVACLLITPVRSEPSNVSPAHCESRRTGSTFLLPLRVQAMDACSTKHVFATKEAERAGIATSKSASNLGSGLISLSMQRLVAAQGAKKVIKRSCHGALAGVWAVPALREVFLWTCRQQPPWAASIARVERLVAEVGRPVKPMPIVYPHDPVQFDKVWGNWGDHTAVHMVRRGTIFGSKLGVCACQMLAWAQVALQLWCLSRL